MNAARTRAALALLVALAMAGCRREERAYNVDVPDSERIETIRLSELQAGNPPPEPPRKNPYEENAWAMSEGKRLFQWFNCHGCHANGGGGMGPPLMDHLWIYGADPDQIFSTIVQGRPNGMPSFRGKIPDHQVWQLVAYVRSMSGNVRKDAAPGRNDDIQSKTAEQQTPPQPPVQSTPGS